MEHGEQKINISQKAILFNEDGQVLTIRRTETAPSRPLHWDLPGGDLNFGEDLCDGIIREIGEETGLEVENLSVLDAISGFDDVGEFWVTICYLARPITTNIVLSFEHDDFKWVEPDEFQNLKASPRNKKFAERFKILRKIKV
ncbi:MAG: NUDIX hydrolase [Patescibacteria group bacterium]|nr:NUDIX hydrolase [Patescibacteria group bacterium]MDD4611059.1 NUDIX hydrolase [Patescibacteria group bacterium]